MTYQKIFTNNLGQDFFAACGSFLGICHAFFHFRMNGLTDQVQYIFFGCYVLIE